MHAGHEAFDLVEHLVEQLRELIDVVVVRPDRHPLVGVARCDHTAHGHRQLSNRPKSRLSRQPATRERNHHDRERDNAEDGPKPRKNVLTCLSALAHLDEGAIEQTQRGGFHPGGIPLLSVAEDDGFGATADDTHEQAFGCGALLGLHGCGKGPHAATRIHRRVFAKL